jgi:hypothetical protein
MGYKEQRHVGDLFHAMKDLLFTYSLSKRSGSVVMFRCISTVVTRWCVPIGYCESRRDVRD